MVLVLKNLLFKGFMMKKLFAIFIIFFVSTIIYADEFWINPKWDTKKSELEKNYKFTDVVIKQLDENKKVYIDSSFKDKFAIYLVAVPHTRLF